MNYITEDELTRTLGVPRTALRAVRKGMRRGSDWEIVAGAIRWTAEGMAKVLKTMGLASAPEDQPACKAPVALLPEKTAAPREKPAQAAMRVRKMYVNPHIIGCVPADPDKWIWPLGPGGLLRLKVKDNRNFMQGMLVQAQHLEADLWELVGKCPRSRGKW